METVKRENPGAEKWLIGCFFLVLVFTGVLGMAGERFLLKGSEQVNTENRTLAEFPELSMENFPEIPGETENWLNDHAPFRSSWLDAYASLNYSLFHSVDNPLVIVGEDDWFFYKGDGAVEEMIGVIPFTEEEMAEITENLLLIRERFVERPENFVVFIAPDKEKIYDRYLPEGYQNRTGTSKSAELIRYIREHSDIQVVYPEEELKNAAEGEQLLYFRSDTHWNSLGAFVGTQKLLAALNGETVDLDSLTITVKGKESGDLSLLAHLPARYVVDESPSYVGYHDAVSVSVLEEDLEGSGLRRTCALDAPDERKLVLIRDSFGETMEPVLCRYFKEVTEVNWEKLDTVSGSELEGDIFVYEIVERWLLRMPGDLQLLLTRGI